MKRRKPERSVAATAGIFALALFLSLAGAGIPAAAATTTAWAVFAPLTGASGNYTTALAFGTAPGLTAEVTSTSRSGQVGVISGASTWLSEGTPVGSKYGTSRDRPYLNLRPLADAARVPSVTSYTFDSPTPPSGWAFALGDIDADLLQVTAVTASGVPATSRELGFQSGFNYCAPGVVGKPSCTGDPLDVPTWDPATTTLTGNAAAADTSGAAAWFEPSVPLTSLTFTFTARSGFPIYQTWFASIARDIAGTVTGSDGLPAAGAAVELFDTNGASTAIATTDATGSYSFPGYTAAAGYTVELTVPGGETVVGRNPLPVDISQTDAVDVDFTLRELKGASLSGQALDTKNAPLPSVVIALVDQTGGSVSTSTDVSGNFDFGAVPGGDYTLTAETPSGYTLRDAPDPFSIPADSEVPLTGLDFTFAELSSITGVVTVGADPAAGVLLDVTGPTGASTALTDTNGTYVVGDLETGSYTVTAPIPAGSYPLDGTTIEIEIVNDGTAIAFADFDFAREGSVSGVVVDSEGTPIAGVPVEITGPINSETTTAADGGYRIGELTAGDYLLSLTVPDGYLAVSSAVQAVTITTAGGNVTGGDFQLRLADEDALTDPPSAGGAAPTDPTSAGSAQTLPVTGGEIALDLIAGSSAAFLLGFSALYVSRRRRHRV